MMSSGSLDNGSRHASDARVAAECVWLTWEGDLSSTHTHTQHTTQHQGRGMAYRQTPRASADVASAAWSGRALAASVKKYLGGLDV